MEEFQRVRKFLPCEVKVIITNKDIYEVKANNRLLQEATNDVIVLFQDDIITYDEAFKQKIFKVIKTYGISLGLMGGRSGFELTGKPDFPEHPYYRVSNWEHLPKQYGEKLKEGEFKERTFLNRGPLVFTKRLLEEVGYLDEEFSPLWGDDLDYCARAKFEYGKKNVVFQCNVKSQLKWGALHKGQSQLNLGRIMRVNWNLFITRWGKKMGESYENLTIGK